MKESGKVLRMYGKCQENAMKAYEMADHIEDKALRKRMKDLLGNCDF